MIMTLYLVFGLVLGALGGAFHLLLTRLRARLTCTGRPGLGLLLLPVALGGPAVSVLIAARVAPVAAFATLIGLVTLRSIWLRGAFPERVNHGT